MSILTALINAFAPIFLIISPVTSYFDQVLSMHRSRSSDGFSLDIPLIMLTASILKLFYWPGARYDRSLLIQAVIMIAVQLVTLKVALDNRPGWKGDGMGGAALPMREETTSRPWGFWRWKNQRLYWQFLVCLSLLLFSLHVILMPTPSTLTTTGHAAAYTALLGFLGLTIEATLPLPQLHSNYTSQSCKGFRVSVLANWLLGDALKMGFFFLNDDGKVPLAFKLCGCFQAACDVGLGIQWWIYGDGPIDEKDIRLK